SYWYDRMNTLLSYPQPSYMDLFGGYSSDSSKPFDWAISKIVLPDGHGYYFRYNQYGEIVRLDLPTGGRYEFDWVNGPGVNPNDTSCPNSGESSRCPVIRAPIAQQPFGNYELIFAVYRRVKERREFLDGVGASWTRRTAYSVLETASNEVVDGDPLGRCGFTSNANFVSGSCTKTTVDEYDPQSQLSGETHHFYGA